MSFGHAAWRHNRRWLVILFLVTSPAIVCGHDQKPPKVAFINPEAIYAQDPNDSWNRIFCFLFSRRMEVRFSNEFPEGAPFTKDGMDVNLLRIGLQISTRAFERNELGDRAVDPLYPGSLDGAAARLILSDPTYSEFTKALQEALHENEPRSLLRSTVGSSVRPPTRSAVARALMQSDLWAAHDIFFVPFLPADEKALGVRRRVVLDLLARLIRKIALTPEEIKALPDNYPVALRQDSLPDLFRPQSGWIEVEWFPDRQHDRDADYRRVSRIFVKPAHPLGAVNAGAPSNSNSNDMQKFLDARPGQNASDLEGVALVIQLLLIDAHGNLRPTAVTTDVRVLKYDLRPDGAFNKTMMRVLEVSRKLFVTEPESAGLVEQYENSPAYAVENYKFANNYTETGIGQTRIGPPVQVKLRTRCAACHRDSNLTQVRTFAIAMPPHPPRVLQANPAATEEADFDITVKKKRKDFESLLVYFK